MRVVIIGGAMSGATLALSLSHLTQGALEIDVIEACQLEDKTHPGFDARAIAIAEGTYRKLMALDLWQHFAKEATAIKKVIVSDRGHLGRVEMRAQDYHVNALGQVISLYEVGKSLWQAMETNEHIRVWAPNRVTGITRTQDKVYVDLTDNLDKGYADNHMAASAHSTAHTKIEADLLIAADGSHSVVSQLLQINRQIYDYQQDGLIANIETSQPHEGQAFELFTDQGPLALLPMTNNRSTLVWCANPDNICAKMAMSDDAFLNDLQMHFGWRLGKLIKTGKRHRYPLKLNYSQLPISHRTVLIGNAAQSLHPIAGQGFNLGMRDIVSLSYALNEAIMQKQDIGSFRVLSDYANKRQKDREATIQLTDRLVKTFSTNSLLPVIGRNIALSLISHLPILKDKIAHQTLGWLG